MQKLSPSSAKNEDIYTSKKTNNMVWPPHGLAVLGNIAKPSNQHFEKGGSDGVLQGMIYAVTPEPSTLRPIRAWNITIEKWSYADVTEISVEDVLRIRVINDVQSPAYSVAHHELVSDLFIRGDRQAITPHNAFNSLMAAAVIMTKIDAGRLPNLAKILASYQLH